MGERLHRRHGILLPLLVCGLFFLSLIAGACIDVDTPREEAAEERAEEQIESDLERAGAEIGEGMEKFGDAVERSAQEIEEEMGPEVRRMATDASITARIKAKLTADPEINPIRIDVDTVNGKVTLTGTVPSDEVKEEAEDLAQGTDGVLSVDNLLQVVPG